MGLYERLFKCNYNRTFDKIKMMRLILKKEHVQHTYQFCIIMGLMNDAQSWSFTMFYFIKLLMAIQ